MSLTLKEKDSIDIMLDEKDTRIANREANRKEVAKLRRQRLEETDMETRFYMLKSINYGEEMIAKQTRRISELSITNIAKRLNVPLSRVVYYEKSSYVRMKRQYALETFNGSNGQTIIPK
jgi:hypothetical protein